MTLISVLAPFALFAALAFIGCFTVLKNDTSADKAPVNAGGKINGVPQQALSRQHAYRHNKEKT